MLPSLRDYLGELNGRGDLEKVNGVHWDEEIGAYAEVIPKEPGGGRAILFDKIVGYPEGYQLLINSMNSLDRLALAFNMEPPKDNMSFVRAFRERMGQLQGILPEQVSSGPITENTHFGDDIDVLEFPAPKWHPLDGGRYLGTGVMVITKDPETGIINVGTYRVMVKDKNSLTCYMSMGKNGRIHREKWFEQGKPWPVAICFGQHPAQFLMSCMEFPYGVSEYELMGGLMGGPVQVIAGPVTGLPIPCDAEIAMEGEAIPGEVTNEGPFGEWMGYYGSPVRPDEPLIHVKSVLHRNNPILVGCPPNKPPFDEQSLFRCLFRSILIWEDLEKAGVPDVQGVWCHREGGSRLFTVVSLKQRYPGHARQAGAIATQSRSGAFCGRYTVVVDEDIDPSNLSEVIWAIGSRSNPESDIEILHQTWSSAADPLNADPRVPYEYRGPSSRAIIDACRPWGWRKAFPAVVGARPELLQQVRSKRSKS